MTEKELKEFTMAYLIASVKVYVKLEENTFLKGLIDVDKTIENIKSIYKV